MTTKGILSANEQQHLLTLMRQGDGDAFKQIYDCFSARLYQSAYNIVRDRQECEDVLQDLFADLWLKRESIVISSSLKNYLYVSIRNKILMKIRSKRILLSTDALEFLSDGRFTDHYILEKDLKTHLDKQIENLPKKCAQIFQLSRNKELSHKEIANQLNISTKTVENQISIALKKLRASSADFLVLVCFLLK